MIAGHFYCVKCIIPRELLERAVQMDADRVRHAWAWRDLGRVKRWLKYPGDEVTVAYERAIELLPGETGFKDELTRWKETSGRNKGQGNRRQ